MDGKLIVIDGIDSVGKQTQKEMMREYLIKRGLKEDEDFAVIDFPRYNEFSSEFVRAYLEGKLADDPNKISPYLASTFYSIDRALSFKNEKWGEVYRNGGLVIADRYTCSNIIYQGSKLMEIESSISKKSFRDSDQRSLYLFIKNLYSLEYTQFGIPRPDTVVYLMLDEKANQKLLDKRAETAGKDIHEASTEFLNRCRYTLSVYKDIMENQLALYTGGIDHLDFTRNVFLDITDKVTGEIMSREDIHKKILNEVFDFNPYVTAPIIPWLKRKGE